VVHDPYNAGARLRGQVSRRPEPWTHTRLALADLSGTPREPFPQPPGGHHFPLFGLLALGLPQRSESSSELSAREAKWETCENVAEHDRPLDKS